MEASLRDTDRFNLTHSPNFEPRRSAAVPSHVAGNTVPLLYMPIQGGPVEDVASWLALVDEGEAGRLVTGMKQKDLRKWKRSHPGHRSFTVLRHPVARAHRVFCDRILSTAPGSYHRIRRILVRQYELPVPEDGIGPDWDAARHREAFLRFLDFLQLNLSGQTPVRVDAAWSSQSAILQGFGEFVSPDFILREEDLLVDLPALGRRVGIAEPPSFRHEVRPDPVALAAICDDEIEASARSAYQRDYMIFGFGAWTGD